MRQFKKAFTILELLVVIAIIAILSVIAVPKFIGMIEKSRVAKELTEIASVTKAAHSYYMEHSEFPTIQGGNPTLGNPKNLDFSKLYPTYLANLPHFSYWWIANNGQVYHTLYGLGSASDNGKITSLSST